MLILKGRAITLFGLSPKGVFVVKVISEKEANYVNAGQIHRQNEIPAG
jgi:hypothetical protein